MIMEGSAWVLRTPDMVKRFSNLLSARIQNGPLIVECKGYDAPRTRRQRGYLHAVIRQIALARGVHEADLKEDLKSAFGIVTVEPSLVTGDRTARLISTERYSRDQMTAFLHSVIAWAAGEGIVVTEPDHPETREDLGLAYQRVDHQQAREAVRSLRK
jgi:hypothetical protein